MSNEKEVAELWKEWKKSTEKYEEAIEDGYDVDADMWANDVETIHRQIHLYEQAAKADEYEAKAEAFDEIVEEYESIMKEVRNRKFKVTSDVTLLGLKVEKVVKKYERGGSDD